MQLSALDIVQSLEESGPIGQGKCSGCSCRLNCTAATGSSRYQIASVLLDLLAEVSHSTGAVPNLKCCWQMSMKETYAQLCALMNVHTSFALRREALLMSLQALSSEHTVRTDCGLQALLLLHEQFPILQEFTFLEICWARGHAPEDDQLNDALALLPQLRGLSTSQKHKDNKLYAPLCQLLRSVYLRKWSLHRIFCFMDNGGDSILQPHEFEQICRLSAAMDELAGSTLLRLEGSRVSVERQMNTHQANAEDGDVDSAEDQYRCLHFAGLLGHDLLHERQLLESHSVFQQHALKHSDSQYIHIDALQLVLADGLFTWHLNEQTILQCTTDVMAMSVAYGDKQIRFNKFANLRENLMGSLLAEVCKLHNGQETAVLRLLHEHVSAHMLVTQ